MEWDQEVQALAPQAFRQAVSPTALAWAPEPEFEELALRGS
jgi:hypothetical protein